MTNEPLDEFPSLELSPPIVARPTGGWLSLWRPRHTVGALAMLPGLFAINLIVTGWTVTVLSVILVGFVAAGQAVVAASYLPHPNKGLLTACPAIPLATLIAASALLSEYPASPAFGMLAVALAATGVAFRFFATTCEV